ncbi:uncharacterized protein F4822DRAFT_61106 [Hypoxylon trugodes]|uniref:uncharacterized protein n=1 Tax=Hypoxylon trugodes TaxID=326681 RepID=UPI0021A03A57|nr:uncharacterized protein F4822DRAFT_61106 [Hypoxylon trugodes]KAI1384106.1 hypothetical protein F4822DRAFT_61106 [Hypoxylon trugodes]
MSLLQQKYTSLLTHLTPSNLNVTLHKHQQPILLATGVTILTTPFLAYSWSCYQQWRALGRGGVPYNFAGWLVQTSFHLFARSDVREPIPKSYTSISDIGAIYGNAGGKSYLPTAGLEKRKGPRPTVPSFVAPQRQTSDTPKPPDATVSKLQNFLEELAKLNPHIFEIKTSRLEGPLHQAIWLTPSPPNQDERKVRLGWGSGGEFAHVHGEASSHLILSPADAATAIEAGWVERHRLSGVGGARAMVPWGYVLVYAPRNGEEAGVWRELIIAGARYVAEGLGVEVVVPE